MKIELTKEQLTKLSKAYADKKYTEFAHEMSTICESVPGVTVYHLADEFNAIRTTVLKHKQKSAAALEHFLELIDEGKAKAAGVANAPAPANAGKKNNDLEELGILTALDNSHTEVSTAAGTYKDLLDSMGRGYRSCLTMRSESTTTKKERKYFCITVQSETKSWNTVKKYYYKSDKDLVNGVIRHLNLPIKNQELGR